MGVQANSSPNAVYFGTGMYLFYNGSGKDGIWYTVTHDGTTWSRPSSVAQKAGGMSVQQGTTPNGVVFGGRLYLFYTGGDGDGVWCTSTSDGQSWAKVQSVKQLAAGMGVLSGTSPSAAAFQNTLYLFYVGSGKDGIWYTTTSDGKTWSNAISVKEKVPGMGVLNGTSPSAVPFRDKLYLFYAGSGEDGVWYTTSGDGKAWSTAQSLKQKIPGMSLQGSTSPAASVFNGSLYLFYTGSGGDGLWYTSTDTATSWRAMRSLRQSLTQGTMGMLDGTSGCLASLGARPFVFWNGAGKDGIYCSDEAALPGDSIDPLLSNLDADEAFAVEVDDPQSVEYLNEVLQASVVPVPLQARNVGSNYYELASSTEQPALPAISQSVALGMQPRILQDDNVPWNPQNVRWMCIAAVVIVGLVKGYTMGVTGTGSGYTIFFKPRGG